jgi:hypothetical protein
MAHVPLLPLDKIADAERRELMEIIDEARGHKFGTERYISDAGDSSVPFLFVLALAAVGIVAGLLDAGQLIAFWRHLVTALPGSLRAVAVSPQLAVFPLAVIAALWAGLKLIAVLRGHGWALTSFGFVRVRGRNLRIVRFDEIKKVARRVIGTRRKHVMITLTTTDGRVLDGYAGRLYEPLLRRLPPTAYVVD